MNLIWIYGIFSFIEERCRKVQSLLRTHFKVSPQVESIDEENPFVPIPHIHESVRWSSGHCQARLENPWSLYLQWI